MTSATMCKITASQINLNEKNIPICVISIKSAEIGIILYMAIYMQMMGHGFIWSWRVRINQPVSAHRESREICMILGKYGKTRQ